jgi:hypothetical protein
MTFSKKLGDVDTGWKSLSGQDAQLILPHGMGKTGRQRSYLCETWCKNPSC